LVIGPEDFAGARGPGAWAQADVTRDRSMFADVRD
jgi:hypothetical protein